MKMCCVNASFQVLGLPFRNGAAAFGMFFEVRAGWHPLLTILVEDAIKILRPSNYSGLDFSGP